jgi:SAM-dependent methyltransferase
MLETDANGSFQMFTEEREVFEDQTVVEFRYDMNKPGLWKWIPLRVRYDKTADFKSRNGLGANDYKTADNNWNSIHNPVTERMIATGEGIPSIEVSDDVYYNSVTNDKLTQRMRDFHNLYVKKALIQGVSKKGNTLIDFSCGKAGDLPKWISAGLSFVFGIDISKDNIENRLNGACARYLNYKKTTKTMPYALFANGNSSLNIRSGTNMFTDKTNEIVKSIFGNSGINKSLGPAVIRQHGKGINGFDISSCQFSIHYMFENKRTFYNFIRNVAECTKLNGYFIATCYDGQTLFNMLKKKNEGESRDIYIDDKKVWSVTKLYDATTFDDNETSLGYKIDVYQDSINQTITEYLVNFDLLTSTMDKYGFTLVSREEAKHMGLPEGSGMFSELYNSMMNEIKRDPKKENDYKDAFYMKEYEKNISFLNRYFIYKKTSTRNAEKLTKSLLDQLPDAIEFEEDGTLLAKEAVKAAEEIVKPKAKKLHNKLKLQEATEVFEEAEKAINDNVINGNVINDNVINGNVINDNVINDNVINDNVINDNAINDNVINEVVV